MADDASLARTRKKKAKPEPIQVPEAELQYELCVAPGSQSCSRSADAAACSSLDGTFRDFKSSLEISRSGLRLGGQSAGLGLGRTPSAQDLSILGSDPDLWSSRPSSSASSGTLLSPSHSNTPTGHRRQWSTGSSEGDTPLTPGAFDVALRDLRVTGVIGRGTSGCVHSAVHAPSGRLFALKVIPLDVREDVRKRIIAELRCLHAALSCPAIVPLHAAFLCEGSVAIVLEFMDRGSLADWLARRGPLAERHLRAVAARVLMGLSYLHSSLNIIHRDLKPSNLLLNSRGEVKISDFGVSGQLAHGQAESQSWVGTFLYMAPERLAGQSYSFSSDCWALGVTLLECATGAFPYALQTEGLDFWELLAAVSEAEAPQLPPEASFSPHFNSFFRGCLQKQPHLRKDAEALRAHPWVDTGECAEEEERMLAELVNGTPLDSIAARLSYTSLQTVAE